MNQLETLVRSAIIHETIQRRSGGTCDYYVDSSRLLYQPELLALAADRMLCYAISKQVTHIGGEATSALPLTGAILTLSHLRKQPIEGFMIRKSLKPYGKSHWIEGSVQQGDRVVLVDDVTGMGSVAERCCQLLFDMGIEVAGYVSVVDRSESAKEVLSRFGVELYALFQIEELLEVHSG